MKKAPPLSPELEALLAPHRTVLPLAEPLEARAVARAAAAAKAMDEWADRVPGRRRRVFAAATGAVLVLGAAAYAAHAWLDAPSSDDAALVARIGLIAPPSVSDRGPPMEASAMPEPGSVATIAPHAAPHGRRAVARTAAATIRLTNEELQLLRTARQDATNGDFGGALVVIAEHTRRFRNGGLVEEREALRVKSLAGLGRHEEAQRAAAAFHARFPHSVFLSTFEHMNEADR